MRYLKLKTQSHRHLFLFCIFVTKVAWDPVEGNDVHHIGVLQFSLNFWVD